MTPKERVRVEHATGIVSVWHHGVCRPVVHSETGDHCSVVVVAADIRDAIAEAEADENKRCCEAIRAACGVCKGTGRRWRVDEDGAEYEGICSCEHWYAAIRKPPATPRSE